jgi:hypothetical protein
MAVKSKSKSARVRAINPKDAGTVAFVLRFFKVLPKDGKIGNLRLQDEPPSNAVFFRDYRHLETLLKGMMRSKKSR